MVHQDDDCPNSANLSYVESLYASYLRDPDAVDPQWRREFDRWEPQPQGRPVTGPTFQPESIFHVPVVDRLINGRGGNGGNGRSLTSPPIPPSADSHHAHHEDQHSVDQLIRNYRVRGHIIAELDPLGTRNEEPEEFSLSYYDFTEDDLDRRFHISTLQGGERKTLRQIIQMMRNTYCRYIGVQYMHISDPVIREWLQYQMEESENTIELSRKEQVRILTRLTDAVIFEQFMQKKFIGAKRFSLEGAESLIPLLDMALEKAGSQRIRQVVISMAHRGRLNVLANIIGKSPQKIFREFEDVDPKQLLGRGDVKYHQGYSGDWRTRQGQNIHLSLCFNPSHLEFANPVAIGRMRAKQDYLIKEAVRGDHTLTILIHGDASFSGEGIVQETLNLSNLNGYQVGGALHIVVNNQIGYTTSPADGRSTRYATDVARMLQCPIFHVNGESPEAVAQVIRLALDFRQQFKRDVVVDMYCYRRRGHNEGDEPSYTQPRMYNLINRKSSVRDSYLGHLLKMGGLTQDDADQISQRRTEILEKELIAARSNAYIVRRQSMITGRWEGYEGGREEGIDEVNTTVGGKQLVNLLKRLSTVPGQFKPHPKIKRLLIQRGEMAAGKRSLDWSAAEALALATLSVDGHRIRLSGQDSQRGTFSHRHAVLHDINTGHMHMPLAHLNPAQAPIEIINSPLSEAAVLGFEYGYSLDAPPALVVWEAQFGDFANAAQVIIDQFITSAEDKWHRLSGIVLLLPHGFEGQGPEHSSARLERFLDMAAEDNIQIANPTTPAQLFHLLRRQVLRRWRKPLVVMTPKSLLRHPKVVCSLDELAGGGFQRVIDDDSVSGGRSITRVLLCSGKIYYELMERREKLGRDDVAIVRLEQYYPLPMEQLRSTFARYRDNTQVFWVQEEPANMGAWRFIREKCAGRLFRRLPLQGITRPESASPATGSRAAHQIEQDQLLAQAFSEG